MQTTILILRDCLRSASDSHGNLLYDDREIRSIISLLLEEVCGITRVDRIMRPDLQLSDQQRQHINFIAAQLRLGIPVQQALGYAWFCDRKFSVTPDVLIPRPETAELVDWISDSVSLLSPVTSRTPIRLLDIGTGSGCIGITLARVINNSQVLAVDLSTSALRIACQNSCQQSVDNIQFAQCDILMSVDNFSPTPFINPLSPSCQQLSTGAGVDIENEFSTSCQQFEIIVSNPPYICRKEAAEMSDIVLRHEPDMALFVPDDDPLLFYRAIAKFGTHHLVPGGFLFFEINAAYGAATCQLLRTMGYSNILLRKDICDRDRMIRATFNSASSL